MNHALWGQEDVTRSWTDGSLNDNANIVTPDDIQSFNYLQSYCQNYIIIGEKTLYLEYFVLAIL